jgi:3-hydroxyisobutyrate dehydrogenase-like beta-hydroxyacid dehydrogenase
MQEEFRLNAIRVGQVGLGNLGFLLARSIAQRGFPFTVCDLRKEPVADMQKLGARSAQTPREVVENSDVIISIVNDIADTEKVIFGKDGMWEGIRKGSIIMLCSTLGPEYCKRVCDRAREKDVHILDVGMSKDGPGEEIGSQTVMVGGDKVDFEYCRPVLEAIAKHVFYVGPIGTGQAFKVVNNLLAIAIGTVTREALNAGVKGGLDLQTLIDVMRVSTGGSWSLNYMDFQRKTHKKDSGVTSVSRPAPTKNIGLKDWSLAVEYVEAVGAQIPIARFIHDLDTRYIYGALAEADKNS